MSLPLEKKRARLTEGEMAYVEMGEGPPVLLLHGYPTSSFLWRREIWLLAQRMRVIAPDLLGYGESDKPVEADLSEQAQVGHVVELLDHLGIRDMALVGHDIGGGIAQMMALDSGRAVRTMVLLDSVCFDAWPVEGVRMVQGVLPEQETPEFAEDIVRVAFVLGVAHQRYVDEDTIQSFLRPWEEDPGAFFRATRAITGKGLAGRDAELAALEMPTLIVWGEEDPFLPSELAERLGEIIPGSTVALLPGCSHFVTEDAPQTVGPLVYEYLRSRYLGEGHGHPGSGPVEVFLERPSYGWNGESDTREVGDDPRGEH